MGMSESRTGLILDAAGPRAGSRSVRTLIGSIGNLGFLVKHLSSDTGQGAWRLFANERNLASHMRAMALGEAEVQRVLTVLVTEGRVVLPDRGAPPPDPAPKPGHSSRPPKGVSPKTGPR